MQSVKRKESAHIISIAVEHLTILADYFIICSAKNVTIPRRSLSFIEDTLEERAF